MTLQPWACGFAKADGTQCKRLTTNIACHRHLATVRARYVEKGQRTVLRLSPQGVVSVRVR